ncbi:sugar ABC transporter permease [Chloroflexia bacterium SDU3-3]|nr:sugar ABC transporter permease [Chloroflexia bacterium SDU3-3]
MATISVPRAARPTLWARIVRFFSDQRKWAPYLFIAPFFITFALFTLYPLLRAVLMAFQESLGYGDEWEWVGLANFAEAFTNDGRLQSAFRNALLYALGSIVTQLPVAFGLALLLTSRFIKSRGLLRTLFYVPVALPGLTMGAIGAWFFNKDRGFANALLMQFGADRIDWLGFPQFVLPMMLTLAFWSYVGSHVVYFIAGITGVDPSIEEAAIVDGANLWQRIWHVLLPLLRPVIAYMTITMTAGSLMIYEVTLMLYNNGDGGGPGGRGWFLVPYITWLSFNQLRLGYATAIGWMVFAVSVGLTVLQLKLYRFGEVD